MRWEYCGAGEHCICTGPDDQLYGQSDRYGIYAGRWHDSCWEKFGYKDFVFDAGYAGESLEEEW